MADVWNPTTREYIRSVDRSGYGEPWVVIGKGAYPIESLPECDPSLWELVEGEIVEGEPPEVVESMSERHTREQREGVTLANGWQMAYTREARDVMGDLKNLIDLAGPGLPGVSFWEVDGTKHDVTVSDAVSIMTDYAVRSATEVMRQFAEVSNG
jgi:hypothetical protein